MKPGWLLPKMLEIFGEMDVRCEKCKTLQRVKLHNDVPTIVCERCKMLYVIRGDLTVDEGKRI